MNDNTRTPPIKAVDCNTKTIWPPAEDLRLEVEALRICMARLIDTIAALDEKISNLKG